MQIVGDIREARIAIIEVTERLRRFLFRDTENPKDFIPSSESTASHPGAFGIDSISPDKVSSQEGFQGIDNADPIPQSTVTPRQSKVVIYQKQKGKGSEHNFFFVVFGTVSVFFHLGLLLSFIKA